MLLSRHIPVSHHSANKLPVVASQSSAILPDSERRFQPTRLTSTYHLVASLETSSRSTRWVKQVCNDTGNMPSTLWRSAIYCDATALAGCVKMMMIWWIMLNWFWIRKDQHAANFHNCIVRQLLTWSATDDKLTAPWSHGRWPNLLMKAFNDYILLMEMQSVILTCYVH